MALVIPGIILAAGRSSRMGRAKATLDLPGGETFLARIVRTLLAGGVDDVNVVLGHDAESIAAAAGARVTARVVVNEDYDRGQLSSLQAGLAVVDRPGVVAALVTLIDVPLVSAATVTTVLDVYRRTHAPIVRPASGSRHGHPFVIDRSLFDAIRAADAAEGAKPVIRAHASAAGDVPVDDEGAFMDIDTPEDLRRALQWLESRAR